MQYRWLLPFFSCFILLLGVSSPSHANSNHNIYMMTLSILSYAKLNQAVPEICVVDNTDITTSFQNTIQKQNMKYKVSAIETTALNSSACTVIFFSHTQPQLEQKLISQALTKNALTFSTSNSDCEIGSVFCLYTTRAGNTQFKVNLDSLAKTKIHIDPRVLLLAQNME